MIRGTDLGARILRWTQETFGLAISPRERALRLLEEAVELAQTEGVTRQVAACIVTRVFSRPEGNARREVSQVALTLWGYCEHHGLDPADLAADELRRVELIPRESWLDRQVSKAQDGICDAWRRDD